MMRVGRVSDGAIFSCSSQPAAELALQPPLPHSFQRLWFASAAGYRACQYGGGLYNVGTNGNYWSSSPYSATDPWGGYLNFNSSGVNSQNTGNRANGFSVRCVQHLPELLLTDKKQFL